MKHSMAFVFTFILSFSHMAWAKFDHEHAQFTQVLKKHTLEQNNQVLVDYKAIQKAPKVLNEYLSNLEKLTEKEFKTFSKDQKLAFWINVYNAYTLKLIVDHYPVQSIRDINKGLLKGGPWKKKFIKLLGKSYSLDDVEHGIIRKDFKEARIHFAVNCASIGCPSLFQEAFVANKLEDQLKQASLNFLNNPTKNKIKDKQMQLSKIFDWYGSDFDAQYGSYKNFIIQTLKLKQKNYSVSFLNYDWSLNQSQHKGKQ